MILIYRAVVYVGGCWRMRYPWSYPWDGPGLAGQCSCDICGRARSASFNKYDVGVRISLAVEDDGADEVAYNSTALIAHIASLVKEGS